MRAVILISLIFACLITHAQQQPGAELSVVSQTMLETIPYTEGDELFIDGKKAEIIINTWDRNEIKVQLKITSKHPERKTAEKDLQNSEYTIEKLNNAIYVRNNPSPDGLKISSNIQARYQVVMPKDCPLNLRNNFGSADIEKLNGHIELDGEFSTIRLNNVQGDVNITSYFGDIEAQYISGQVKIDSKRSNIDMSDVSGDFDIKAKFGVVRINTNQSLINLDVEAEKSDVYFNPLTIKEKSVFYNLLSEYGSIYVPKEYNFNILENSAHSKKAILGGFENNYAINIATTFGKITIGQATER